MKFRKTAALALALFVMASSNIPQAFASTKRRIAIMPFEYGAVNQYTGNYDVGKGIVSLLTTKLVNDGTYSVVDRQMLDSLLKRAEPLCIRPG
jgi:curli biogenesis system outer membrane secretion channel CsgG